MLIEHVFILIALFVLTVLTICLAVGILRLVDWAFNLSLWDDPQETGTNHRPQDRKGF